VRNKATLSADRFSDRPKRRRAVPSRDGAFGDSAERAITATRRNEYLTKARFPAGFEGSFPAHQRPGAGRAARDEVRLDLGAARNGHAGQPADQIVRGSDSRVVGGNLDRGQRRIDLGRQIQSGARRNILGTRTSRAPIGGASQFGVDPPFANRRGMRDAGVARFQRGNAPDDHRFCLASTGSKSSCRRKIALSLGTARSGGLR